MTFRAKKIILTSLSCIVSVAAWLFVNNGTQARVFERGQRFYKAYGLAGFEKIHSATMEINGQTAVTEVFSADEPMGTVAARFADAMKSDVRHAWFHQEDGTAYGFAQDDGKLSRFLFVPIEHQQTLLYVLHQEYPAKESGDAAWPTDFPEYPGAQAELTMKLRETNSRLLHYRATTTAQIVGAYYEEALVERGWKKMPLDASAQNTPDGSAAQTFTKGKSLCVIQYQPDSAGGIAVTVLLKDLNL